jgi:pilus assembly protein CpaF
LPSLSERVAAARQTETTDTSLNRNDALSELRGRLHFKVVEELGPTLYDRGMSDAELRLRVLEMLEWAVDQEQGLPLTSADRRALLNEIASDVLGYGPIDPLLNDPDITEVMANGPYDIYFEKAGRILKSDVRFVDEVHLPASSTRSSARSAVASTRRHRWSMPVSPMAPVSTPSSTRWPSVVPT